MDYDMVNKMKVDELKRYLSLRGLKVTGKKAELVARVFVASETYVQPKLLRKLRKTFEMSTRQSYYMVNYFFIIQFIYCLVGLVKNKGFLSGHL